MNLHPRLSRAAVELVKQFEPFHGTATPTVAGGWTIGYGHTATAREGARVSRDDAEALLLYDLSHAAEAVEHALFAPVPQGQFEALTALAFNIGPENFRRSSALARINAGAPLEAADEIERWRNAELGSGHQVVDALVRRRAAEKAHFLSLPAGVSASPTGLLRPQADGVDPAEPSVDPEAASPTERSATLNAANNVQARLRELIPDVAPAAVGAALAATRAAEIPRAEAAATPAPVEAPARVLGPEPMIVEPLATIEPTPLFGRRPLQPEPPPPPFANDHGPPAAVADPLSEVGLDEPAPATGATREPVRSAGLRRRITLTAGVVGLLLFLGAVASIVLGKANIVSLAAGVAGAVAMMAGVYTALGRSPSTEP